jgi:hypothetical protein
MQFKVPQNIDMEDKIIGPLTLVQFFYLLFGGLIIYILFTKLVPNGLSFIFWILAIPLGLFSFAMAFVKVQDRPFPVFVVAFIKYFLQPRTRVWQHYEPPKELVTAPKKTTTQETTPRKELDIVKVNELAHVLDEPGRNNGQK